VASVNKPQRFVLPAVKVAADDNTVNVPAAVSAFAASLVSGISQTSHALAGWFSVTSSHISVWMILAATAL
jgi:hypothetical protein